MIFLEVESHGPGSTDSRGEWAADNRASIAIFFVDDFADPIYRGEVTSLFGVSFKVALEPFKLAVEGALMAGFDPVEVRGLGTHGTETYYGIRGRVKGMGLHSVDK